MYHVLHSDTWDPDAIVQSLQSQNVTACVSGGAVRISLPSVQTNDDPRYVKIEFRPDQFIRNIHLDCDYGDRAACDRFYLQKIDFAIRECGYLTNESDRQISERYCPADSDISKLFDEIERVERQKEDYVMGKIFRTLIRCARRKGIYENELMHCYLRLCRDRTSLVSLHPRGRNRVLTLHNLNNYVSPLWIYRQKTF